MSLIRLPPAMRLGRAQLSTPGSVNRVRWSRCGRFLFAEHDLGIGVLNLESRSLVQDLARGRPRDVTPLADGETVATSWERGKIACWNFRTGEVTRVYDLGLGGRGFVCSIALSPDGAHLAIAALDSSLYSLRLADGEVTKRTVDGERFLRAGYSPDGTRLAAGGEPGAAHVWDASAAGAPLFSRKELGTNHEAVIFSPDGSLLVVLSEAAGLFVLRAASGELVWKDEEAKFLWGGVEFTRGGRHLLAWGEQGKIGLLAWEAATGAKIPTPLARWGSRGALSPDETRMAVCRYENFLAVVDLSSPDPATWTPPSERDHPAPASGAGFSLDGSMLHTITWEGARTEWNLASGDARALEPLAPGAAGRVITATGAMILTDGKTLRIAASVDAPLQDVPLPPVIDAVATVALSDDATTIAVTTKAGAKTHVLACATGSVRAIVDGDAYWTSLALTPDGSRLLTTRKQSWLVWNVAGGRGEASVLTRSRKNRDYRMHAAWLGGGSQLVIWSMRQGGLVVAEAETLRAVRMLERSGDDGLRTVVAPPRGDILVGNYETCLRVWDTASGALTAELGVERANPTLFTVSRDSRRVAAVLTDATIAVWNLVKP